MSGTDLSSLETIKSKLLQLHPGRFVQDDAYLERWASEDICSLFMKHGLLFRPTPEQRSYIHREYGPLQCVKNALHYATLNDEAGVSAWWSFALYWDDHTNGWVWWMHCFCLSADGGTLFDPTVPPTTGPDQPALFYAIPWGLELYRLLVPDFPVERLPPLLAKSIYPVLEAGRQAPFASCLS